MHGLAVVLMQSYNGKEQLAQFASHTLVKAEYNYTPIEAEALAILFAL